MIGQKEKESIIPSSRPKRDKKGRAIPQKRQASLSPMPKINGLNQLIPQLSTIPGKLTVPFGTGIQKTTGKTPRLITKAGRRLRIGSRPQAGLLQDLSGVVQMSQET